MPIQNLNNFILSDLAKFTKEGSFDNRASKDFHLMFVGVDNVHEALKYIISCCTKSLIFNQFGYDDDELNGIIMTKVKDPSILTIITLDKSQAGGVHEAKLIELDKSLEGGLAAFNSHFVIGQSATHQISHTKGGVVDGKIAWEGSTNWSPAGEGYAVKVGTTIKAQNNTNTFITDPDSISRFTTELMSEHLTAQKNATK